ncbi:MAG: hypothetical protein ACLFT3_19350, partial [Cyclobacteriaceae bacterium]
DVFPAIARKVGNDWKEEGRWEDQTKYQLKSSDLPKGYSTNFPISKNQLRNSFALQFYDNDKGENLLSKMITNGWGPSTLT